MSPRAHWCRGAGINCPHGLARRSTRHLLYQDYKEDLCQSGWRIGSVGIRRLRDRNSPSSGDRQSYMWLLRSRTRFRVPPHAAPQIARYVSRCQPGSAVQPLNLLCIRKAGRIGHLPAVHEATTDSPNASCGSKSRYASEIPYPPRDSTGSVKDSRFWRTISLSIPTVLLQRAGTHRARVGEAALHLAKTGGIRRAWPCRSVSKRRAG